MHEYSLVKSLLQQADQIREANQADSLVSITLELGPLSGVEEELVRSAFVQLAPQVRLVIERVPVLIHCQNCDSESVVNDFCFRCLSCGADKVRVTQGDQFRLRNIVVRDEGNQRVQR